MKKAYAWPSGKHFPTAVQLPTNGSIKHTTSAHRSFTFQTLSDIQLFENHFYTYILNSAGDSTLHIIMAPIQLTAVIKPKPGKAERVNITDTPLKTKLTAAF